MSLLGLYRDMLLPDAIDLSDAEAQNLLADNTACCVPFLWLITDANAQVLGAAALMDLTPGRQAFLHGVTHPAIRRHPVITQLALTMFRLAFEEYSLQAIKAEFSACNRGAWGFCRRMGFQRETSQSTQRGQRAYRLTHQRFQELIHPHNPSRKEAHHADW
jgi:RimJ/RimL family protein N-acetyltransferase